MFRRVVSGIMLTLLLISMFTLAFNIQPVKSDWSWTGTAYVRADGSVEPSDAPISTVDNITYTLTDNIVVVNPGGSIPIDYNVVVVERDNIVVNGAGYTVQGFGGWTGITLYGRNITIKNMEIRSFWAGIWISSSSNNSIVGNNIKNNDIGINLYYSSNNKFYHNNFVDNTQQALGYTPTNVWDDGYPSGGNYWSDYDGTDLFSGPYQNVTGSDGIGDTPYILDADNQDRYPLTTHDIGITSVTTSKTVVGQGYDVSISIGVTAENQGDHTETFNVTIYANATVIASLTDITLTSGSSTTLTFAWDTTDFAKGKYIIKAVADTVQGEVDIEDNTFIDGIVTVTIAGDINGDFCVNLLDILIVQRALGSVPGDPNWDPRADLWPDGIIDFFDLAVVAVNYGSKWGEYIKLPGPATVYVDPPTSQIAVGRTFTVNVSIANVTNLYCYEFKLYYNTTILDCLNVTLPSGHFLEPVLDPYNILILKKWKNDAYNATHGLVWVSIMLLDSEAPRSGSGVLVTITFNATAKGLSFLDLDDTVLGNFDAEAIPHTPVNGTKRITMEGDCAPEYGIVDIFDIAYVAVCFGAQYGKPPPPGTQPYNPNADIIEDKIIDIFDIAAVAVHFGEKDQ